MEIHVVAQLQFQSIDFINSSIFNLCCFPIPQQISTLGILTAWEYHYLYIIYDHAYSIITNSNLFKLNLGGHIIQFMPIISIEGNIGAGKTTLLSILDVQTIKEPVDDWENTGGNNLLQCYYANPKRWAFTFQLNAIHTRCSLWENTLKKKPDCLLFSERSPFADRHIFGEIMERQGNFNSVQYAVYDSICRTLLSKVPLKKIIYLKCSPQLCLERVKQRNRKGEEGIGLGFLEKLHEKHEQWIQRQKDCQIMTIDTSQYNFLSLQDQIKIKKIIEEFISSNDR